MINFNIVISKIRGDKNNLVINNGTSVDEPAEISLDWCKSYSQETIDKLGDRYSEQVNFRNSDHSDVYEQITEKEDVVSQYREKLVALITIAKKILARASNEEFEALVEDIRIQYNSAALNEDYKWFLSSEELIDRLHDIIITSQGEGYYNDKYQEAYDVIKRSIRDNWYFFVKSPVLCVTGQAGVGKSHLLADIVTERSKCGLTSLFVLGRDMVNHDLSLEMQVMKTLGLQGTFVELLEKLNSLAEKDGHRLYLVIDGVNESANRNRWNDGLSSFVRLVLEYQNLGLILSARTYDKYNAFQNIDEDINIKSIVHHGFEGHEHEATMYFLESYKIPIPDNLHLYTVFTNPLILSTYCKTYVDSDSLDISFYNLYNKYKWKVNSNICSTSKLPESTNWVQWFVGCLADFVIQNSKSCTDFTQVVSLPKLLSYVSKNGFDTEYNYSRFETILDGVVREGLITVSYIDGIAYISFTFEKFYDYEVALRMLESDDREFLIEEFLKYYHEYGILDALVVLHFELYSLELFEKFLEGPSRERLIIYVLRNLRDRSLISHKCQEFLKLYCTHLLNKCQYGDLVELIFPAVHHEYMKEPINKLVNDLFAKRLIDRDSTWTATISPGEYHYDYSIPSTFLTYTRIPLQTLSQLSSDNVETISSLLFWFLTSTNRQIRALAIKACVKLLLPFPKVLNRLFMRYYAVDDLYVKQGVCEVAFACVFRTDKLCEYNELGNTIYSSVFCSTEVVWDIRVRDFSKSIIDYLIKTGNMSPVNVSVVMAGNKQLAKALINKSITWYDARDKYVRVKDGETAYDGIYRLVNSMSPDMDEHLYGDFGRYIFESCLSSWDNKISLLAGLAIQRIMDVYGYDADLFNEFERNVSSGRGRNDIVERIGKKYQWCVLSEIVGILLDTGETDYSDSWHQLESDRMWNFSSFKYSDSTLVNSYTSDFLPRNPAPDWLKDQKDILDVSDTSEWLNRGDFKKKDVFNAMCYKDDDGYEWIPLFKYITCVPQNADLTISSDFTIPNLWMFYQAYIIDKKQKSKVISFFKRADFRGRQAPEASEMYELYYREIYKSSASEDYFGVYNKNIKKDKANEFKDPISRKYTGIKFKHTNLNFTNSGTDYAHLPHFGTYMPSLELWDLMKLDFGLIDKTFIDESGEIVAFDASIYDGMKSCLYVRKDKLTAALKKNDSTIIWTVLTEAAIGLESQMNEQLGVQRNCFVYLSKRGKLRFGMTNPNPWTLRLKKWALNKFSRKKKTEIDDLSNLSKDELFELHDFLKEAELKEDDDTLQ